MMLWRRRRPIYVAGRIHGIRTQACEYTLCGLLIVRGSREGRPLRLQTSRDVRLLTCGNCHRVKKIRELD